MADPDLLEVLDEVACWCRRDPAECAEAGGCRWSRRLADLEHDLAAARRLADRLQSELDAQVTAWRDRIMRDTTRRYETGRAPSTWVVATRHLPGPADEDGLLHYRDPMAPPRTVPPTSTTPRTRYLTGEVREAGPGSYIGKALCGLPLMADELWVRADHLIKTSGAGQDPDRHAVLCGLCSYLAGQPTPRSRAGGDEMKVPARLSHLRTDRRGIPVPWINLWGDDEDPSRYEIRYDRTVRQPAFFLDDYAAHPNFLKQNHERQRLSMVDGLCQVCGRPVPWSRRFLIVSSISVETVHVPGRGDVAVISEPWLDKFCGRFALTKCPGLIRRRNADDLHIVPVTSRRQVELVVSHGWVDGPLEEESKRVQPAMWVKVYIPAAAITVLTGKAEASS